MKWKLLLGWGIVIYSVAFLTWSILIAYGISGGIIPKAASLLILMVVSAIAGRSLHFSSWEDILPYSFIWALIIAALDGLMAVPYVGWKIYAELGVWIGYTVVIIVPLFFTDEPLSTGDEFKKRLT